MWQTKESIALTQGRFAATCKVRAFQLSDAPTRLSESQLLYSMRLAAGKEALKVTVAVVPCGTTCASGKLMATQNELTDY